jgi:ATP-dependent RNA helicase DDX24/MAK5
MGIEHLAEISRIRFLVLDEADRMIEKGHFEDLDKILTLLPQNNPSNEENQVKVPKRQTFIFSATLCITPFWRKKKDRKKKNKKRNTPLGNNFFLLFSLIFMKS